jgi:hypothetical protein
MYTVTKDYFVIASWRKIALPRMEKPLSTQDPSHRQSFLTEFFYIPLFWKSLSVPRGIPFKQIRLTDTLPNNTCKLHTDWKKTNLLNVGSDLGACVGEGAVAGPAGGGAVGGVAQLPAQAAVHVAHLLNHSHSHRPFIL